MKFLSLLFFLFVTIRSEDNHERVLAHSQSHHEMTEEIPSYLSSTADEEQEPEEETADEDQKPTINIENNQEEEKPEQSQTEITGPSFEYSE
jgi:hypothetical protein